MATAKVTPHGFGPVGRGARESREARESGTSGEGELFRPPPHRQMEYLLRHSGMLRTVIWAASTSRKRKIELPCLVICP